MNYLQAVHHIGYLVKNISKSMESFQMLGYTRVSEITYDAEREIEICFMKNGDYTIELVCPMSNTSVVSSLIKKIGVSAYHICYEVEDLVATGDYLRTQGYLPIAEAAPAPAIEGRKVAFYYSKNMGMIELVETVS